MPTMTALLGLMTETPLHAGTGQAFGLVDLPIQREAHTGFPCVYGSGVKGALRARSEDRDPRADWILEVFGPEAGGGKDTDHAGALAPTDARLLLLPVRSLTSFYKWVTCPAILRRFDQDRRRFLGEKPVWDEALTPADAEAVIHAGTANLFLEEFRFAPRAAPREIKGIIDAILPLAGGIATEADLQQRLAIVSDDLFSHLARFATPVAAHIRIEGGREVQRNGQKVWEPSRKTVQAGALWYEETLPPDTVLYVGLLAENSRRPAAESPVPLKAEDVLDHVRKLFPERCEYLQIGGNETVGMGWCRATVLPATAVGPRSQDPQEA